MDTKDERKVGTGSALITVTILDDGSPINWWASKVATRPCDWNPATRAILWPKLRKRMQ